MAFNRLRCGFCLVGMKTCSHADPFWIRLDTLGLVSKWECGDVSL
ncbi:hypothetical protein QTP70_022556 [Hemibagrus guttatus]|uniref:Uncharacterized protein n=1 Tax=Hemibagrus guttatus TaxID=175788 RepID=A0AAE0QAR3_9TELE|nr:hypothetical protein QTP70_022556 [Hemibagrus guttatus]